NPRRSSSSAATTFSARDLSLGSGSILKRQLPLGSALSAVRAASSAYTQSGGSRRQSPWLCAKPGEAPTVADRASGIQLPEGSVPAAIAARLTAASLSTAI